MFRINVKYFKKTSFWVCLFVFLANFVPKGLTYVNHLKIIENLWALALVAAFLLLSFEQLLVNKIDFVLFPVTLLFAILTLLTIINNGSYSLLFEKGITLFGALFLVSIYGKKDMESVLVAGLYALTIIMILNWLGIIWKWPDSFREIGDFWLFGQKNMIKKIVIPLLLFTFLVDYINSIKISNRSIFWMIACPITVYIMKSTTVFLLVVVLELFYIIYIYTDFSIDIGKYLLYSFIILFLVFVVLKNQSFFNTITSILNKSSDLSGRSEIWNVAISRIKEHLILGTGIQTLQNSGLHTSSNIFSQCHDMILELLYKGGIFSLISFWMIWFYSYFAYHDSNDKCLIFIFGLFMGIWINMAVFGEFWYFEHYFTMFLGCYCNRIIKVRENNIQIKKLEKSASL